MTHGSFYLWGGYIGLIVVHATGSLVLAALAGSLAIALLGVLMERFLLRRFHLQELPQTLLTFGFLFIFSDLAILIWGGNPQTMPKPAMFSSVGSTRRVLLSLLSLVHHRLRLRCCCSALVDPGRHAHWRDAARRRGR